MRLSSLTASPTILGIETSCDETAAAVIDGEGTVRSSVLSSQHDVHGRYGGVVPELAARRHIEMIEAIVAEAMRQATVKWHDLHAVAVTHGPGLAGALLVGVNFGKALAYASGVPLIAVNHLEGHMASVSLEHADFPTPSIVLVVSGGHTHLYVMEAMGSYRLIGHTLDDAAGEAFDKGAKMLGLEFPGGPAIDRLSRAGNPAAVRFPRACLNGDNLDFSFSGLKTAVLYYLRDVERDGGTAHAADVAASLQEAIVDVLVEKAFKAVGRHGVNALAVVGGVSANTRLRMKLSSRAAEEHIRLALPSAAYCTDNAAMIAAAGRLAYQQGRFASWDLEATPEWMLPSSSVPAHLPKAKPRNAVRNHRRR